MVFAIFWEAQFSYSKGTYMIVLLNLRIGKRLKNRYEKCQVKLTDGLWNERIWLQIFRKLYRMFKSYWKKSQC